MAQRHHHSYDALGNGLLTVNNGFVRKGWQGSEFLTEFEKSVLAAMGTTPKTSAQIGAAIGANTNRVNGTMSVLLAKGRVVALTGTTTTPAGRTKSHREWGIAGIPAAATPTPETPAKPEAPKANRAERRKAKALATA